MSREVQNLKSDLDNGVKNLERETERSRAIEKELQLRCGENERLAHRVNDQRNENLKLSKLVEELTSNCEMVTLIMSKSLFQKLFFVYESKMSGPSFSMSHFFKFDP